MDKSTTCRFCGRDLTQVTDAGGVDAAMLMRRGFCDTSSCVHAANVELVDSEANVFSLADARAAKIGLHVHPSAGARPATPSPKLDWGDEKEVTTRVLPLVRALEADQFDTIPWLVVVVAGDYDNVESETVDILTTALASFDVGLYYDTNTDTEFLDELRTFLTDQGFNVVHLSTAWVGSLGGTQ